MKLNHFICPNCGHDFFESAAYATCDACHTVFYANQSKTCKPPTATAGFAGLPEHLQGFAGLPEHLQPSNLPPWPVSKGRWWRES